MTYRIKPARQVVEFVSSLPPARRSESKRALTNLSRWRGDILGLQGRLGAITGCGWEAIATSSPSAREC